MWVQQAGGWAPAKMLLDAHGHFMPTETTRFPKELTRCLRRYEKAIERVRGSARSTRERATLRVSASSLAAHLAHWDALGACE